MVGYWFCWLFRHFSSFRWSWKAQAASIRKRKANSRNSLNVTVVSKQLEYFFFKYKLWNRVSGVKKRRQSRYKRNFQPYSNISAACNDLKLQLFDEQSLKLPFWSIFDVDHDASKIFVILMCISAACMIDWLLKVETKPHFKTYRPWEFYFRQKTNFDFSDHFRFLITEDENWYHFWNLRLKKP